MICLLQTKTANTVHTGILQVWQGPFSIFEWGLGTRLKETTTEKYREEKLWCKRNWRTFYIHVKCCYPTIVTSHIVNKNRKMMCVGLVTEAFTYAPPCVLVLWWISFQTTVFWAPVVTEVPTVKIRRASKAFLSSYVWVRSEYHNNSWWHIYKSK